MKIYCISGIGGDHRLFKHVRAPLDHEVQTIDWIPPLKNEPLSEYAIRLGSGIDRSQPFILIGLSLGGIVAVEIAKRSSPVCTILISSIPISGQLPWHYRLARKFRLYRVLPASIFKMASMLKRSYAHESREDKRILRQMIREGNDLFIKWAMQAALEWENDVIPAPLWHIHGDRDEVFPIHCTHPTHIIRNGRHLLLMSHPEEINRILHEVILKTVADKAAYFS